MATKLKNYRFTCKTIDQLEELAKAKGISMTKTLVKMIEWEYKELINEKTTVPVMVR